MAIVLGYRVEIVQSPRPEECGVYYTLDLPEATEDSYVFRYEEVPIELAQETQVKFTPTGKRLICSRYKAYGTTLADALRRGWCRLAETQMAA